MERKARIITEQVFGSSRKIQFIGLADTPSTPMDSLLSAIDHERTTNRSHTSTTNYRPAEKEETRRPSSVHQSMSIESLLATNSIGESSHHHTVNYNHHRDSPSALTHEVSIASLLTSDNTSNHKRRRDEEEQRYRKKQPKKPLPLAINDKQKTIITCLHASVAQKSYGSEKRFLCPPPVVQITSSALTHEERSEKMQLSMSVVCENGDKVLEQRSLLDENQTGSFRYLHVTGTAKAKQFNLKVDLLPTTPFSSPSPSSPMSPQQQQQETIEPLVSFMSKPVSIISKPSKKTAKTRNVSTCILTNSPVCLFNRINSQTVRTKYMTSSENMLCAKNTTWSPFDIIVVNQPKLPQPHKSMNKHSPMAMSNSRFNSRIQPEPPISPTSIAPSTQQTNTNKTPAHISYGTEIILRDSQTGITSPSLIIRKVDKGRIAQCAYGPVSQMQKIALQLASTIHTQPVYLSAAGAMHDTALHHHHNDSSCMNSNSTTWLDFSPSRIVQPEKVPYELGFEEVDDYLCWTIVGINKFEYEFYENQLDSKQDLTEETEPTPASPTMTTPPPSPPRHITPFPLLTNIQYDPQDHTLNVIGQHLIQAAPVPRLLDLWLGTHGPLVTRVSQPPQSHTPHETHWSVQLPSTQDLLVANHDLLKTFPDGRRNLELSLLLVRQDGLVYHTGKALSCDVIHDAGRWTVVAASSPVS
ncbi:hypothetical protein BD560DRAFT_379812 [Blakeslea trispora]|nr:hypothetical protein BD560DRAFT_379812 [Blakeslea trispora]